jgi:hypothetical protein
MQIRPINTPVPHRYEMTIKDESKTVPSSQRQRFRKTMFDQTAGGAATSRRRAAHSGDVAITDVVFRSFVGLRSDKGVMQALLSAVKESHQVTGEWSPSIPPLCQSRLESSERLGQPEL